MWHDIDEGSTAKELVTYDRDADPLAEDEGWGRYTKGRKQQPFHAVILSVRDYNDTAIPDIPAASVDVTQLKTVLTDCRYSVDLLSDDAEETFLLPTRANFIRVVDLALANAKKIEGTGEEKDEALLEKTPPILIVIIARGAEGSLTFLNTGYNSRFAFTKEATYANDRKHAGIIPLASMMQLRDCLGRKPLVVADMWALRGGIQSIKGHPGYGFVGGHESVAGELDAIYPPTQDGGLLTYYFIKALQGKAGKGRGSVLTTCAVNSYISDRLLKQKVAIQTEANHLTQGNRIVVDKDALGCLRKQHKAYQALTRWHKARWVTRAEIPLAQHDNVTIFKTHLLKELYKLVYRSGSLHCEEHIKHIQLLMVTPTLEVSLYLSDAILNPAEGMHDWLEGVKAWCGVTGDFDVREVCVVRCAQMVKVRCGSVATFPKMLDAFNESKQLLGRTVKHISLTTDISFTGCMRDFNKINKATRANILSLSKIKTRFVHSYLVKPVEESRHVASIIVQRLWKGYYLRKRQEILLSLFALEALEANKLKGEEQRDWDGLLEFNRIQEQQMMIQYQMTERYNLEEWEAEDRGFLWQRLIASWTKTVTTPLDHEQHIGFFLEAPDCFDKVHLMTRGCVETWEMLNATLLEALAGQISIIHQYVSHSMFKMEVLGRNEVWGRYNILHEEYTMRLTMQRSAQTNDMIAADGMLGLRVEKGYRPVRPVANQTEVKMGQIVALEQDELVERKGVLREEGACRDEIETAASWFKAEMARLAKNSRTLSRQEAVRRERYMQELEKEVQEDEERKEADANFFAAVAKTLKSPDTEEQKDQTVQREELRRKSDAVKRILLLSDHTSAPASQAGAVVRKIAHRQSLKDAEDLPVKPSTPTFMPHDPRGHRGSLTNEGRPARHRDSSASTKLRKRSE
eukprot:TRINITY_DN19985_c0_g2_i1.p1 TRINITY_DN19985_c0_g2~~TRINITY_DN19985_c0_g2_i1.p1  ORF type:complete len:972 (+),score=256.62 TRINITY_DN19985_c0_g2_i1:172-2916(+)